MRISDWSSDVCSSDLRRTVRNFFAQPGVAAHDQRLDTWRDQGRAIGVVEHFAGRAQLLAERGRLQGLQADTGGLERGGVHYHRSCGFAFRAFPGVPFGTRSEEHTSELQSLMRISYAVFCLKKKNNQ